MVAWKKIMGKFEVGHWMGAKKRVKEKLNKKNASTFGKWRQKKTI